MLALICSGLSAHRTREFVQMIGDPFLNDFALGLLFFVVAVLFYGIIAIHDVPYLIAKSREHPHQPEL
jgi:hypothetical protein